MQYRMNRTITKLANDLTYKGSLKCATDAIALATLKPVPSRNAPVKWIERIISPHIEQSVCFLNTGNVYDQCTEFMAALQSDDPLVEMARYVKGDDENEPAQGEQPVEYRKKNARLYTNYCEAAVILQVIKALTVAGVDGSMIGVVAPYVLQVELLKQIMQKNEDIGRGVEVNTVDQYQGRDKEVIYLYGYILWLFMLMVVSKLLLSNVSRS